METFICRSKRWLSLENFDNEVWLPVVGFENHYYVSNYGRVKRIPGVVKKTYKDKGVRFERQGEKILVPINNGHNYFAVNLVCGKRYVHRLVAQSFIPNLFDYPEVDHINGNTWDNRVENLRWVTRLDNTYNPITVTRRAKASAEQEKPIIQLTVLGEYVKEWRSATAAASALGCARPTINGVLSKRGSIKSALGYLFVYKSDYDPKTDYAVRYIHDTSTHKNGLCDSAYVDFVGEEIVRYYPSAEQAGRYYNVTASCIRQYYHRVAKYGPPKIRREHKTPYHLRRFRDLTEEQKDFIRDNYANLLFK